MSCAQGLGNVSQACREAGISRALFYRWQQRVERYGVEGPAYEPPARTPRPTGGTGSGNRAAAAERGRERRDLRRGRDHVSPVTNQDACGSSGLTGSPLWHRLLRAVSESDRLRQGPEGSSGKPGKRPPRAQVLMSTILRARRLRDKTNPRRNSTRLDGSGTAAPVVDVRSEFDS